MDTLTLCEWIGSAAGIAGALMMAVNTRVSPWAYPVWVLASIALLAFALGGGHHALAMQQAVFTAVNALGCWRWLVRPYLAAQPRPSPQGNL